jgi:hypothetical protein
MRNARKAVAVRQFTAQLVDDRGIKRPCDVGHTDFVVKADIAAEKDMPNTKLEVARCRLVAQARRQATVGVRIRDAPAMNEYQDNSSCCQGVAPVVGAARFAGRSCRSRSLSLPAWCGS